jgi:hypothetical protein
MLYQNILKLVTNYFIMVLQVMRKSANYAGIW